MLFSLSGRNLTLQLPAIAMKKWTFIPVLTLVFAATVLVTGCGPKKPSLEEVERIISVLAADSLNGRQAFSEDAWKAADFIANEFAQNGLVPLQGDTDFIQDFPLYTIGTASISVTLNGSDLAPETVAAAVTSDSIKWDENSDITTIFVGAEDDLIAVWRENRNSTGALVVVHPDQKEAFDRVAGFLRRPVRSMSLEVTSNLVMVLSDAKTIRSFAVVGASEHSEISIANVVGMIPGKRSGEIVVFAGHYDHIGVRRGGDAEADSISNGANDNASGTTAVIQLARYFHSMGTPERTIYFVALTAEESGGYGARYFSQAVNPDSVVAMFNIEMIGKPAVEGPNTAWITGFERSDFGTILQEAVVGTEFSFYADPYPDQNLFYRSDNATLARLGVPAHTISTTPIDVDPDYHQVSDEVATLDLEHLTNTIKAIAVGAATIVSGERTPTRIDPSSVN